MMKFENIYKQVIKECKGKKPNKKLINESYWAEGEKKIKTNFYVVFTPEDSTELKAFGPFKNFEQARICITKEFAPTDDIQWTWVKDKGFVAAKGIGTWEIVKNFN